MPGMLSPCWTLVGLISAPVARNSTFFSRWQAIYGRINEQSTEAAHPQPEPPAWTSCVNRS